MALSALNRASKVCIDHTPTSWRHCLLVPARCLLLSVPCVLRSLTFCLTKSAAEFFIQQGDVHRDIAVASLSVMQAGLHFNICRLETLYVSSSQVADLEKRAQNNIPSHLLYSCQFWETHLKDVAFDPDLAQLLRWLVTGEQLLFWLEALGVSNLIGEAYWALWEVNQVKVL